MNSNLLQYYHQRASEYDNVYGNPAEQADLQAATVLLQQLYKGKNVLEVACGTGYWTERISQTAKSVYATDANESVINIARSKRICKNVEWAVADMFAIHHPPACDGFFGGFIWSHILLERLDQWLLMIKDLLEPGAPIAFIDSNPVAGTSHDLKRISRIDEFGNGYQLRQLANGETFEVLKNFPAEAYIIQKMESLATGIRYFNMEYYWVVTAVTK